MKPLGLLEYLKRALGSITERFGANRQAVVRNQGETLAGVLPRTGGGSPEVISNGVASTAAAQVSAVKISANPDFYDGMAKVNATGFFKERIDGIYKTGPMYPDIEDFYEDIEDIKPIEEQLLLNVTDVTIVLAETRCRSADGG